MRQSVSYWPQDFSPPETRAVRCHIHFRKNLSSITGHLGRLGRVVPQNRRLDREFHVLCPTLAPLVYPPSSSSAQQLAQGTRGMLQLIQEHQPSMAASLDFGFTASKSLTKEIAENATSPNLNFYKIPTYFDEHILSPSCRRICLHEEEHKTILVSLPSNSDPAPDNFRSLAGSWYFILVLSWYCFSVGKRLSFTSSSSPSLLCCFIWCGHLKSEFPL